MKSEIERIVEKGLKDYRAKPVKISGKKYELHVFSEDEDLNLFEGFLFAEPKEKSELSYLITRYRAPVSGYAPRLSLLFYGDQLILKDYRKNKLIIKTLRKVNKTFISKLKRALLEPTESNFNKLFDRTDIIEEFYILYKNARAYLLDNAKGISEEDRRIEFVDNFMMQMHTLWFLQEKGFFDRDTSYFITKFKDLQQKKLSGGFDSYYQFLAYFFDKIKEGDTLYYEDTTVGEVVIVGPAIFLDSGDEKAITIQNKCFYKDGMTEILINRAPKKVSQDVPLFNLFESRDWVEGDIDEFVLGALYEKLMTEDVRKKTGSYYTPEEITSYICKNTIEPYLVDRVNEKFNTNFESTDQIIESSDKEILRYLFKQLKDIKVLDPAVGSAHFLESAINVLLCIYEKIWDKAKDLGLRRGLEIIAADEQGKIKPMNLLEIGDLDQLKMFVKFFIILSKNIYGVDINPSAINIAKARMFLTIARHFKTGKYFIRFPNVHFNLRDGNSLIGYLKKGEEKEEVKTESGQLSLDFFIKEKEATYIVEAIKVVSVLRNYLVETAKTLGISGDILKQVEELNRILSKKEINWGDFEKVLRTKEKLIRVLIASLNSQFARPLNELVNRITELFNEKLDKKFADEYGLDLDNLKEIKTFHWIFEFPEVFLDREGFDVVIGNPPYGFRGVLSENDKKLFRKNFGVNFPSGDIAELFFKRGIKTFIKPRGYFSFIIPKKSIYGESWAEIRKLLRKYYAIFFADAGKAFASVKLEMVILRLVNLQSRNKHIERAYFDKDRNSIDTLGYMDDLNNGAEPFYIYGIDKNKEIYELIKNFPYLSNFNPSIEIGQSNITEHMRENKQDVIDTPIIKGKDISRYKIRTLHYLPHRIVEPQYLYPKLVFQKIIAHIENPFPHIELRGILDKNGIFTIHDTAVLYSVKDFRLKSLLVLLNSKFISWFLYNFAYNRAIRTMDFIDYYAKQISVPQNLVKVDDLLVNISMYLSFMYQNETNEKIIEYFDRQIADSLVYELYFKEKFHEDGLYPEPKEYLLELVSKHLKSINYDRWAELYWKKQLEEELTVKEEKELEKQGKENLKIIEDVYNALIKDKEIQEQIERIKEHEWVKVIEGENEQSRI